MDPDIDEFGTGLQIIEEVINFGIGPNPIG